MRHRLLALRPLGWALLVPVLLLPATSHAFGLGFGHHNTWTYKVKYRGPLTSTPVMPSQAPVAPVQFAPTTQVMMAPVVQPMMMAPVAQPTMMAPVAQPMMMAPVAQPTMMAPVAQPMMAPVAPAPVAAPQAPSAQR